MFTNVHVAEGQSAPENSEPRALRFKGLGIENNARVNGLIIQAGNRRGASLGLEPVQYAREGFP